MIEAMNKHPALNKTMAIVTLSGLVMATYVLWARPYQLRWGASNEEVDRPMPGDDLSLDPTFRATRAITISGTPHEIWPWLVQMGYGRAGFYGYDKFAVYVAALLIFLAAVGLLLLHPLTLSGFLVGLGAGAAWLIIWYAPISIWTGCLLSLLSMGVLIRGRVRPPTAVKPAHHKAGREPS
jgi:hypothetical protein